MPITSSNSFFDLILSSEIASIKNTDFLKEKIAQAACKAAVKAGDNLTNNEIETLINIMLQKGSVSLCPHGRPTIIKLTKHQIESWFKRV